MTHAEKLLHKAERAFVPETALKYIHLASTNPDQYIDRAQKFASYRTNAHLAFTLFPIAREVQKHQVMNLVHDNLNLAQQSADVGSVQDGLLKIDRATIALRTNQRPNHYSAIAGLRQITRDAQESELALQSSLHLYAVAFLHYQENLYKPAEEEIHRLLPDRHAAFIAIHKALMRAQLEDIHDQLMPLVSQVWITKSEVQHTIDHLAKSLPPRQYQK